MLRRPTDCAVFARSSLLALPAAAAERDVARSANATLADAGARSIMSSSRIGQAAAGATGLLLVLQAPAHAGTTHAVDVEADRPGVSAEIRSLDEQDTVVATCIAPCSIRLGEGRYRMDVESDAPRRKAVFRVDADTRVEVRAGTGVARTGQILGITGTVATGVALLGALLVGASCISGGCDDPATNDRVRRDQYIGVGIAGVSAIVAVTGWVLFFRNRTSISVSERRAAFFAVPQRDGFALGLAATF
jgi:hypothetical protein